ncbi:MogA/MoaB family molybdenum cofactor biosynthesis protein [Glycomyces sp. NPDC049804]|uniref:MogA/MoaB family molybdenum cofactor biosynthesis protein n=1 Tax=Glycomyces sp. NPDC049804 TaxID=3154363 RepID=UPI0034251AA5
MAAVKAVVVVASNRAADGVYADESGPILAEGLRARGFDVVGPVVVHDGDEVEAALRVAVGDAADLVVTSGGTGLTSKDLTPEMTSRVVDYEVPGIAEAIRAAGLAKTPHAALSRGIAGVAERTLIVNLAGSKGAAKDGLAVLTAELVEHAVSQLHDGDHDRGEGDRGEGSEGGGEPIASHGEPAAGDTLHSGPGHAGSADAGGAAHGRGVAHASDTNIAGPSHPETDDGRTTA